jgi:hypothetical protein
MPLSWSEWDNIYNDIFIEIILSTLDNKEFNMNLLPDIIKEADYYNYNDLLKLKLDFIRNNNLS